MAMYNGKKTISAIYSEGGSGAYVDVTTNQEIGGEKTFNDKVKSNDIETTDGKNIAKYNTTGATSMEVGNSSSLLRLFSSGRPTVSKNGVVQGTMAYTSDVKETPTVIRLIDEADVTLQLDLDNSAFGYYSLVLASSDDNYFMVDGTKRAFPSGGQGRPCKVEILIEDYSFLVVFITNLDTRETASMNFTANTSCNLVNSSTGQGLNCIIGTSIIGDY